MVDGHHTGEGNKALDISVVIVTFLIIVMIRIIRLGRGRSACTTRGTRLRGRCAGRSRHTSRVRDVRRCVRDSRCVRSVTGDGLKLTCSGRVVFGRGSGWFLGV